MSEIVITLGKDKGLYHRLHKYKDGMQIYKHKTRKYRIYLNETAMEEYLQFTTMPFFINVFFNTLLQ